MPGFRARAAATATAALCAAVAAGPAPAGADRRMAYAWTALGDSYTAGAVAAAGEEIERVRDGCSRTRLSYPQVIAERLGSAVALTNVSCANATIRHVAVEEQRPVGHHTPPLSNDPDHPFEPVALQLHAVRPNTDVVTVGIGGGTLGLAELLGSCITLGAKSRGRGAPCKERFDGEIGDRLTTVREHYDEMLTAIHDKAPFAKVITVGYPRLIPEDTRKCAYGNLVGFATITRADLDWLRTDALEALNTAIREVADEQGDVFVDLYTSSRGHSVCDKAGGR
ncbi:GDSL-like Lipase/Acylhydrolase family protein, partial [Sinosporangium album]